MTIKIEWEYKLWISENKNQVLVLINLETQKEYFWDVALHIAKKYFDDKEYKNLKELNDLCKKIYLLKSKNEYSTLTPKMKL